MESPVTGLRLAETVAGAATDGFAEKCTGCTSARKDPSTSEHFQGQEVGKWPEDAERQQQEERDYVRQEEDTEVEDEGRKRSGREQREEHRRK
ncbi:hypothetical protein NDU88_004778 [Pleurodeles waltl]|uniref:Uncharacterized protein n=1 Tax=Pleurodeles waltl TaxID=8319 RepID=A0AAV7SJS7_PLEWA|nr:hypothetical protein NDU88_004778 [Pleurodeles waltl]